MTLAGRGWNVPLTVEVCVAGRCTFEPSVTSTAEPIYISNPGVTSGAPTEVTVTVRRQGLEALVAATKTTVLPTKIQPNGPDCEPTVWRAAVTVTPPS